MFKPLNQKAKPECKTRGNPDRYNQSFMHHFTYHSCICTHFVLLAWPSAIIVGADSVRYKAKICDYYPKTLVSVL